MEVTKSPQGKQPLTKSQCNKKLLAIKDAMDLLEGKWKIHILAVLCDSPMRYSDILREVDGISGKMLSRQLKEMELNKLVTRNVINTQPLVVEYQLTDYGLSFRDVLAQLALWGERHREHILKNQE
ncbi:helix-turn-helix transcriptional regulator [Mucilaginibacter roseus]|uniref:Helix-turn-helix transcriptional regulator n=1 Tax=Mucilaginibacter roseus TaxID=1528868 RepID=A0ABS8U4C7_9SPHI|nr:helix-turn-helix domain-containing protein [Mucilaginibacter roseus]MCD8740960.1 helix-turn-helix transcriptional regulator [Mucilaginibacter roseus]